MSIEDQVQINELRPTSFDDFIGKTTEKKLIKMMIDSAKARQDVLDHILLYGPPGLGKTTLAGIISKELNTNLYITSAPSISSRSDLTSLLMNLNEGDVLFIDEIHRLSKNIEEFLYPVMEDYVMDIVMGKGMGANIVRVPVKKFTLIGATTRVSNIADPMRDRFGLTVHLDFYNDEEICQIVLRSAKILDIYIHDEIIESIAQRSHGTARVAGKIVKLIRDYITVKNIKQISKHDLDNMFEEVGIDDHGLDRMDRKILETMYTKFNSRPVSLSTLVAAMSEDKRTIEEYYEPHLIKKGFLEKTNKGRVLTDAGIDHIRKFLT